MSCAVNVSGAWKYAKQAYVNVGGSWKPCQNIYVNVSGAWKPLYTYSYATGLRRRHADPYGHLPAAGRDELQSGRADCGGQLLRSARADEAHHESVLQYPIMHRVQGNRFIWGELRW